MLIVRVEMHSAVTGEVTEIARMEIVNDGTSNFHNIGHYWVRTLRGRTKADLDRRNIIKESRIEDWPRMRKHVWCLVSKALGRLGYGWGYRGAPIGRRQR
jgi:hypothetical protein